jgi:hypothetical protein
MVQIHSLPEKTENAPFVSRFSPDLQIPKSNPKTHPCVNQKRKDGAPAG